MRETARAAAESERAAADRMAYVAGLALHPEWLPYASGRSDDLPIPRRPAGYAGGH